MQCSATRRSFFSATRGSSRKLQRIESSMHRRITTRQERPTTTTMVSQFSSWMTSPTKNCHSQQQQQHRWFSKSSNNDEQVPPPPSTAHPVIDPFQFDRRQQNKYNNDDDETMKGKTVEQYVEDHNNKPESSNEFEIQLNNPSISIPTWRALIEPAARAKWRSSPHNPPYDLAEEQFLILQKAHYSSKHLRRVHERLKEHHSALSGRRERERRRQINPRKIRKDSIAFQMEQARDLKVNAIPYRPEQTLAYLKFRLLPNYAIIKRVLMETQSLLSSPSATVGTNNNNHHNHLWNPKRIIDFGVGCGSASAAALDVFGSNDNHHKNQLEWIHGIDPSQCQREAADLILQRIINAKKKQQEESDSHTSEEEYIPPRITLGESLSIGRSFSSSTLGTTPPPTTSDASATSGGGFDLALYTYTANEMPHVASTLTAAAILWEKLRPNGVMIIIEPGTPDGFNTIRSIRDMLLQCCPPPSLQKNNGNDNDYDDYDDDDYHQDNQQSQKVTEECHVIAPCTHNGTCPMERHIADFEKKDDKKTLSSEDDEDDDDDEIIDEEDDDEEEEEEDLDDFDWDSLDDYSDDDENKKKQMGGRPKSDGSGMDKTSAFDTAFCSFVHTFPGGTTRRTGEKFSYLVVQKRVPTAVVGTASDNGGDDDQIDNDAATSTTTELQNVYNFANVSDLLAETSLAGKAVTKVNRKKAERFLRDSVQHDKLLQDAETLKDQYYALDGDKLGLELLHGDENRQGFGRIVRAPLKRRGHILLDYCGQDSETGEGRIVRHRVSRGWSKRVAPGIFGAARKARWGGYWPDIKDKITENTKDESSTSNEQIK